MLSFSIVLFQISSITRDAYMSLSIYISGLLFACHFRNRYTLLVYKYNVALGVPCACVCSVG